MQRHSNSGGHPYQYVSPQVLRPAASSASVSARQPAMGSQGTGQQPQHAAGQSDFSLPACPESFPEIQRMPLEQIRTLLNDPAAFDKFIDEHPHTRRIEEKVENIKAQITELEAKKRSKQEELKRLSVDDSGKSVEELLVIEKKKHEDAKKIYDDWLSRNSRAALNQRLEDESRKLKRESDIMQKRFLSGEIPSEQFIKDYRELRRRYHELMIKLEFEKARTGGMAPRASAT